MGFFTERELFVLVGAVVCIVGYLLISDLVGRRRQKRAEREDSADSDGER